jgi:hypothetical protein
MKINWGKALILFFGLFFVWVIGFVLFALRQNVDLVSDDYYQKGAKYSDQISINQRSGTYQDSIQISQTGNQVQVALSKSLAATADSVQVYFFRSSDKKKDIRLNLKNSGSPLLVEKSLLSHGRYQLFVTWHNHGEHYMVKKLFDMP